MFPETEGSPPVSRGSVRGLTFQAGPKLSECDPGQAQSANPAGMEVALADGSVRVVRAGVAETTYWALVTPAAGDVAGDY